MSSRPLKAPYRVITNGDMSGDITSSVTIISNISLGSYIASWSGATPIGTLTVEVSNDYSVNADGSVKNPGTWVVFPSATGAVSGNTGTGAFDVADNGFYAMRLKYTRTSGTGTMQAYFAGKVF